MLATALRAGRAPALPSRLRQLRVMPPSVPSGESSLKLAIPLPKSNLTLRGSLPFPLLPGFSSAAAALVQLAWMCPFLPHLKHVLVSPVGLFD